MKSKWSFRVGSLEFGRGGDEALVGSSDENNALCAFLKESVGDCEADA